MLFRHWQVCLTDYKGFVLSLVSEGFSKGFDGEGAGRYARLRLLVLSRLERRRLRGDHTTPDRFLRKGRGDGGANLFSSVLSARAWGNGSKPCSFGRFRLDIRKCLFTNRVVTHWKRLPGEVVDSLCLSVFKGQSHSPLITSFIFSQSKVSGSWTGWILKIPSNWNILFLSILICYFLFYSKVSSKHIYKMPVPSGFSVVYRHVIPTEISWNSTEVLL